MDFINTVFGYLTDKNRHISAKVAILLLVLLGVLWLNDIMGFTYYYNARSKIEQVKALNEIVINKETPDFIRSKSLALESEILARSTFPDRGWEYISGYYLNLKHSIAGRNARRSRDTMRHYDFVKGHKTIVTTVAPARNDLLFLLTSAGVFVMMGLLAIPIAIGAGIRDGWASAIAALIAIEFILFISGAVFYFLLGLIPLIGGSWLWSYLISGAFQLSLLIAGFIGSINKKKAKAV